MDAFTKKHLTKWCREQRCSAVVKSIMIRLYKEDPEFYGNVGWSACWRAARDRALSASYGWSEAASKE